MCCRRRGTRLADARKETAAEQPVALFVVIGGIAAGVTGQRLILVKAMIEWSSIRW